MRLALSEALGYAAAQHRMTELGLILASGLLGLAFAGYLARWVFARGVDFDAREPGHAREASLRGAAVEVRMAAEGFLRRQSSTIGATSAVLGGAVFLAYGLLRGADRGDPVPALELGVWLTISFAVGAAASIASAQVGGLVAARASARAAVGARRSIDEALQVALRAGAVAGLFVSSVGPLGLAGLFTAVFAYKGGFGESSAAALRLAPSVPLMISGYALGGAFAALLAQLGGGAFAKAADIGADLAAYEAGLPEDDARNAATVADLAGDAAGGAASRASAVFAATAVENLGAMLAGAALYRENASVKSALAVMLLPLVTRGFGVVAAVFGVMVVRTDDREDPLAALGRGLYVTATLHAVGFAGAAKWLLGDHWLAFFGAASVGIAAGVGYFHLTPYFTEARHRPVREIADAARVGPTHALLQGVASSASATAAPAALAIVAALIAFVLGARTGLSSGGLYGVAIAAMGMLGTMGYVLAMDGFGPVVDAAGGIVEMTLGAERPDVRGRATVLDGVGNTARAFAKAHGAGAAAIASFLLVSAYADEIARRTRAQGFSMPSLGARLSRPEVAAAAALGLLLAIWLAARCGLGVARTSRRVLDEARRQMREGPAATPSTRPAARADGARVARAAAARASSPVEAPDYAICVELVARAALRFMMAPAVATVVVPVAVGMALRFARTEDNPLLAADAVAALALGGTIAGILGSLFCGHAGAAWDNAKKYIATGAHGGRHLLDERGTRVDNPAYAAARVGDAVGDALKDTIGPALFVLAEMLPVVTLVFLPFFV